MKKHKSDRLISVFTIVLLVVGLLVIYSIGPMRINYLNAANGGDLDTNYYFWRQLRSVGLALVMFFVAFKVPYEKTRKIAKWLLILGIIACIALAILVKIGSSLASCQLGACRWFNLGPLGSFQPAELLKLGLVFYLAQLAEKRKQEDKLGSSDFFIPVLVVSVISLFLVVFMEQDLGTGVTMVAIIIGILFASGVKLRYFAIALGILLAGGVGSIVISPHRMERVATFLNGEDSDSYHIENALMAIGTGGLTGVGVGNSVQATGYLPESINDSVFAAMGETFGFLGLMAVILAFAILLSRILKVAELGANDEQKMIAVGVFSWIVTQMAVNIMAMTGLIPLTGITLPLLSYGGTSMIFVAIGLGLCAQMSCYTRRKEVVAKNSRELRRKI